MVGTSVRMEWGGVCEITSGASRDAHVGGNKDHRCPEHKAVEPAVEAAEPRLGNESTSRTMREHLNRW